MSDIAASLRAQLRNRREALGLTQTEVAERMGTVQSAVSDLERGSNPDPCINTIARWAHALGLEIRISARDGNQP